MDARTFTVLAEPTRLQILNELRNSECHVGHLIDALGLTQPLISKHLKVLRDAGFVRSRTDAQRRVYRLESAPFEVLDEWLEPYRELWMKHLDGLERHLEEREKIND
ncbi:MAG: metalloregulator ArsR/SmtB family transcription factor [Gammaproteobacteria bacterium]|nr:metalloregulator ArsR/SmtB family transcription factor [Gammaproteobacteria bacterium]